jgi:hypothetical protein
MNLFYTDKDPEVAARDLCDKHVCKMILEAAQMMCTAHIELESTAIPSDVCYKRTHVNHPSSVWVRSSRNQYAWCYEWWYEMCMEYERRYGKEHLTYTKLSGYLCIVPHAIHCVQDFVEPPQCMPDEYKHSITHVAYRDYMRLRKLTWRFGRIPISHIGGTSK